MEKRWIVTEDALERGLVASYLSNRCREIAEEFTEYHISLPDESIAADFTAIKDKLLYLAGYLQGISIDTLTKHDADKTIKSILDREGVNGTK